MRSLRNVLYFVVGLLIAFNACLAHAMNWKAGTYYQYGSSVTRKVTSAADAKKLSSTVEDIWAADQMSVGVTTQLAVGMESNLIQAPVRDTVKIGNEYFVAAATAAVEGGLSGGVYGALGSAASALVGQYIADKGYKWLTSSDCQAYNCTAGYNTAATTTVSPTYSCTIDGVNFEDCNQACLLAIQAVSSTGHDGAVASVAIQPGLGRALCTATTGFVTVAWLYNGDGSPTCKTGYKMSADGSQCIANSPTYTSSTPADVASAIKPAVTADVVNFAKAMINDGSSLPIPDNTPTTVVGTPTQGTPVPTQTTTNNPDGSTTTKNNTKTPTYTPTGGATVSDPITVNTTYNTTTNTTECNASGTCSTTTTTATTASDDASKNQCETNPDSIGCSEYGDPPSVDIPTDSQTLSYSWNPFSVPAACPADAAFTVQGRQYTFSYKYLCDYASMLKAVVLLIASVVAAMIIFGFKGSDEV